MSTREFGKSPIRVGHCDFGHKVVTVMNKRYSAALHAFLPQALPKAEGIKTTLMTVSMMLYF